MKLELTYTRTKDETEDAQALQSGGRNSKWRKRLTAFAVTVLGIWVLYVRIKREMPREDRPMFLAIAGGAIVVYFIFKRVVNRKADRPVRLEASDCELVFNVGGARTSMPWSAFGQCLESPDLFVLVDRRRAVLFIVPKGAFPDEAAQSWFRTLANQPQSVAPAAMEETLVPGRFVASHGIALTWQLKFRDYLNRNFTSWRMKGLALFIFVFMTVMSLCVKSPPDANMSRLHAHLILIGVTTPMFLGGICVITYLSWLGEKKLSVPQHMVLTNDSVEFTDQHGRGRIPWSDFKYYLENRWSFFVWNPQSAVWMMFPKRQFTSGPDLEQFKTIVRTKLTLSRWFYL